jgi:hypothetical protein
LASMAHRVLKGLVGGCALLLGVTVAGCAAPQFTYVSNSSRSTYFKIPRDWHQISAKALAAELNAQPSADEWIVAYEPSAKPAAADFGSVKDDKPFVFADVGSLNSNAINQVSYNALRDVVFPVTATARSNAEAQGSTLSGFKQIRDDVLTLPQGVHGVRETYQYTFKGGVSDTFDQIALTNADQTVLYLLYVHCTNTCYSHHQNEINQVMSSFTVRSP